MRKHKKAVCIKCGTAVLLSAALLASGCNNQSLSSADRNGTSDLQDKVEFEQTQASDFKPPQETASANESKEQETASANESKEQETAGANESKAQEMTDSGTKPLQESKTDIQQTSQGTVMTAAATTAEAVVVMPTAAGGTGIAYEVNPTAAWVAIDAGHQSKGNSEKEPVGPGASEQKAKVASGTSGKWTQMPEYELTLQVAMKLKERLLSAGYNVLMIRETNEVNISNAERAELANAAKADAFVRIHANGSSNPSANGILTMCPTPSNPYCGNLYSDSRKLSEQLLAKLLEKTGAANMGITETDAMSGINWCQVPVTIVEMGFMTNEQEDRRMAEQAYQMQLADGMAEGIAAYLKEKGR